MGLTVLREIGTGTHPWATTETPQLAFTASFQKLAIAIQPPLWQPLVYPVPFGRVSMHKPLESVHTYARWDAIDACEPCRRVGGGNSWKRCAVRAHAERFADDGRKVWQLIQCCCRRNALDLHICSAQTGPVVHIRGHGFNLFAKPFLNLWLL